MNSLPEIYKKLNTVTGWLLFMAASVIYIATSEPTASFWDCGEYIATAFKLQVGHPPGAPFFQLIGRFFSLLAFGNTVLVARMINTMSALSSGLTIAFLFWSITMLAKKLFRSEGEMSQGKMFAILGSGIVGALAYTFSDSFWFSAVEGEVYAMSALFTAMTFWAILRWEAVADEPHAYRWLILIAYLIGLSIGVHLLNLLAIPAVTFVYYFKTYKKVSWKAILLVFVLSMLMVAFILYGVIPEVVTLFANTELLFVNKLGLPFSSGTIFFALVLLSLLVTGFLYTTRNDRKYARIVFVLAAVLALLFMLETKSAGDFFIRLIAGGAIVWLLYYWRNKKTILNAVLLSFVFILIGYSTFFLLIIRANASTPINENNPGNAISLLSYLNREQYGETPLFYGQYYNAPVKDRKDGNPVYARDDEKGKYVIRDDRKGTVPVYDPDYMTFFPRMWNNQESQYIEDYKKWAGIKNDPDSKKIPTFSQNLKYFWRYQINHMYFRYLFWNFAGRQNDTQGMYGDVLNGNWISGINFMDQSRLGPQKDIPVSMKNSARNTFYFLPLLLGILGLYFQFKKDYKDGLVVALLFFMTGLAIVVYLNQQSPQPRERDYAFAASFYAYAMWIGIGALAMFEWLRGKMNEKTAAIVSAGMAFLLVPMIMGSQGWHEHDRSGRYTALQMAENYLNSCAPNAILFTNGDNDTFPLWYAQEVEEIRTDVRVCNLSLLNTDWYIDQMVRTAYNSDPVPFSLTPDLYRNGSHDFTYFSEQENIKDYVEVKELFDLIKDDDKILQINTESGPVDYFPTKKFRVTVDPAKAIATGTVPRELAGQITNLEWKINRSGLTKNYLMMMDLIAHNDWERPIYYVTTSGSEPYIGLEDYLQAEGLTYRLVPIKTPKQENQPGRVNTTVMYDNVMNKFEFDILKPGIYLNDDNIRMSISLRNTFSRLAKGLIAENKKDSALRVCDRCVGMIPDRIIPYNYFNMPIAEVYLQAGEAAKGIAMLQRLIDIQDEQLSYYLSFPRKFRNNISFEIQQCLAMLNAIRQSAEKNSQIEIAKQAEDKLNLYYGMYTGDSFKP